MQWKCCTQYASKFGKLSSGHRTGKGQFSFQSQRRTMPKNAETTTRLRSFHMPVHIWWWFSHKVVSDSWTYAAPLTIPCKSLLSMGFSRQDYWSGLLLPSQGDLPDPGIESRSSALQADCLPTELWGKPHASKFMFKILQARLQQYMNQVFQMFKLGLEKAEAEDPEIKLPIFFGSQRKQVNFRKKHLILLYWLC